MENVADASPPHRRDECLEGCKAAAEPDFLFAVGSFWSSDAVGKPDSAAPAPMAKVGPLGHFDKALSLSQLLGL
jgi:hypothetical protein